MRNKFEDWTAYYYWNEERQTPFILAEVNKRGMGTITISEITRFLHGISSKKGGIQTGSRTAAANHLCIRDPHSYSFDPEFNTIAEKLERAFDDLRGNVRYRRDHNLLEEVRPLQRGTAYVYAARKARKYSMEVLRTYAETKEGRSVIRSWYTPHLTRRTGDRDRPIVVYKEERP